MKSLITSFAMLCIFLSFITLLFQQDVSKSRIVLNCTMLKLKHQSISVFDPKLKKAYGYTHAVKIGDDIKISGAVSMDDAGNPTVIGDLAQQMKNCYSDLDKVLNITAALLMMLLLKMFSPPICPSFLNNPAIAALFTRNNFQPAHGSELKN